METTIAVDATDKEDIYHQLIPQIRSLLSGENDLIANLANLSAALKTSFRNISWVGFYLAKGGELVLGPFQGKPACVRIKFGRGVCGTSAEQQKTLIVPDVSKFPGHIYCDPDSKSEIVLPIIRGGKTVGVLDLDSDKYGSFDEIDAEQLAILLELIEFDA
jgi:GAF domain-containing protein